jgi:hypothetical protein
MVSHRFHENKELCLLIPMCSNCISKQKYQTSPWTPALLEQFLVQEIHES